MVNKIPYQPPKFQAQSFNCPFCNAYAHQTWSELLYYDGDANYLKDDYVCLCSYCKRYSIWHMRKMVYPDFSGIELPNDDLTKEIKEDYLEAASIVTKSPRGAAALLRLAIQKLCVQLGGGGKNLNVDIGDLVKRGLPVKVQESLDTLRVIGNEAIHPGKLDLKDDINIAMSLFQLINFIVEKMISEPKEIEIIYNKIPESKKQQIKERDEKK